ncbi:MAG: ABC transporter permease [Gammaproteobacteria bacterium]|nr:ABC transporter permease [Gammaproteobacteria bacterium]
MSSMLDLAVKSLWNRRLAVVFTLCAIAFSVTLLLGVERLRTEARNGFANTISGVDLIVGARSGGVQLLLYSVFHIGNATNNVDWRSYQDIAAQPQVAWTVPISLGDSHRGYRVVGTDRSFFEHYHFAGDHALSFVQGSEFTTPFEAVLGAEVAHSLNYRLGQQIVLAHGAGEVNLMEHTNMPFHVVGILGRTGTPLDRTVLVSVEGITAIHVGWEAGVPTPGLHVTEDQAMHMNLTPKTITAMMVGLKSRIATFRVQRYINDYRDEPLLAILPGATLQELWDLVGVGERMLLAVSAFVVVVGMAGLLTVLLAGLEARRREMAVLRSVGAHPRQILGLILGETAALTLAGIVLGVVLLYGLILILKPVLESQWGLYLGLDLPTAHEWILMGAVFVVGLASGLLPAWLAYHRSLADGLTVRL